MAGPGYIASPSRKTPHDHRVIGEYESLNQLVLLFSKGRDRRGNVFVQNMDNKE